MANFSKKFFQEQGRKGGKKSRAAATPEQRKERARKAAKARWARRKAKS
jgi:general stress protein YciG